MKSSVTNLMRQNEKVQNVFCQLLWKLKDHFSLATPSMLLETKTFEKKKANFPVKKRFWPFFLVLSSVTSVRGQCVRVQKVF